MKSARKSLTARKFASLSEAEKEAVYQGCEKIGPEEGKLLTAAQRRSWQRAKRRMGRPRIGLGAEKIRVSVERGLLRQSDAFARKHGLSRSELIARGLRAILTNGI